MSKPSVLIVSFSRSGHTKQVTDSLVDYFKSIGIEVSLHDLFAGSHSP